MSKIEPVVRDASPDPEGVERQEFADSIDIKLENGEAFSIVADGHEFAVRVRDQYLVYEEYQGVDGRKYGSYRAANRCETHLLRKIEGLNNFFVTRLPF